MSINGSASGDRPIKLGDRVLSRRRLAKLTGVDPTHIGMIFKGRRHPSIQLAIRIAEVFEVTVDELFVHLRDRVDEYLKSVGIENGYMGVHSKPRSVDPSSDL